MQEIELRAEGSSVLTIPDESVIFGTTAGMMRLKVKAEKLAPTGVPVLIRGESGTGKEILAKYLHLNSLVAHGPFVKVNCAAIPGTLLESEMFGHERGAFTGAFDSKPGRVEMADGGTLFLDEIGEMEPSLQAKLLHFIQDCAFTRIGGRDASHASVRIICATNCDLEKAMRSSTFRPDLFYRIDVVSLRLPPLKERRNDIDALVDHFIEKLSARFHREAQPLSPSTMSLLRQWEWPGNIRELENTVARYIILGSEEVLHGEFAQRVSLVNRSKGVAGPVHLKKASREAALVTERELILRSLEANQWNRRKAARELNISYRALLYKIRDAGLPGRHSSPNGLPPAPTPRPR